MPRSRHLNLLLLLGILLIGWPATVPPAQSANPSAFGANTHIAMTYPFPDSLNRPADVIAQSGLGWAREEFQWGRIEPRPGQFDWTFTDRAVNELVQRGINIVGLLNPAVGWGTPDPSDDNIPPDQGSFYPPDPQLFARFAATVVNRYKDRVRYWQVWNEPDNAVYWRPAPDPAGYAALLRAVYPAIKQADPGATVLAAGIVSPEPAGSFLQAIADNGAWGSFDVIALHPYTDPNSPEEGSIDTVGIGAIKTLAARLGPKPIWVTEFGWSDTPSDRTGNRVTDLETQANYLVRAMVLLRQAGVERVIMFRFKDMQLRDGVPFNGYGLLRYGSGQDDYTQFKPAFNAFRALNQQVGGRQPLGLRRLSDERVAFNFERAIAWQTFPTGNGSIAQSGAQARSGNGAAEVRYRFATGDNDYVSFTPRENITFPAGTTQLGIWVYGDGSSFDLKVQLRDAQGEILQYRLGKIGPAGWQQLVAAINGPVEQGNRIRFVDGKLDGDITLQAIVIDDDPDSRTGEGVIYLDDLTGFSGPEAYAARFAADRGVVEVVWAVGGGQVRIPSADPEVTIIDRDGGQRRQAAPGGVLTLDVGPRPVYLIYQPAAAAPSNPPPNPQPPVSGGGFVSPNGSFADDAMRNVWQRTDQPVANGAPGLRPRSWIWGPQPISGAMREPYAQSPGGSRLVQYFDKSRMEINNPDAPRNQWYVTNGLLVVEMLTGRLQLGDAQFEERAPASEAVAGDPASVNPNAPTYATLRSVAFPVNQNRAADRVGQVVTAFLNRDGAVVDRPDLARYNIRIGQYEATLGHNIPQVFLDYFAQQGIVLENGRYVNRQIIDWLFVMGLPISEPYWARVKVGGVEKDVLMQAFERRVLTYTPDNDPNWRVEMGNVGQHYLRWRYGQ
ncbi:flagellar filament outer layer protein FlaA [Chloroflexus sp.]|uniref:flagellar filament outer layer protein FlaA n=1 Tax=Chloroflexus sp. TaxID=1904827 RepID=UPI0026016BB8|nr:flagellar filament outer layer protein FlaA [uncultured Chloroflexus sp.]